MAAAKKKAAAKREPVLTVRAAGRSDRQQFNQMLKLYLEENAASGCDIVGTERTTDWFDDLFVAYAVTEGLLGTSMLAEVDGEIVGFSLAGETRGEIPWDTSLGRVAFGWALWVRPEWRGRGLGTSLVEQSNKVLERYRFDVVLTNLYGARAVTSTATPHMAQFATKLR